MPRVEKFSKCNLDELMKKHNVKLLDLSDEFDVSYQQIQKYKAGLNEMPLVVLFKVCQKFNCSPEDIYPEIEMYYGGYSIPKTESKNEIEQDNQDIKTFHITHNYYGLTSFFSKLFTDIKILDTNAKGSLLIKIAYFVVVFYLLGFYTWRALGFHAGLIPQLLTTLHVISVCFGLIAPLVIRHPLIYVTVFLAFHLLTVRVYYLITLGISYNHVADTPLQWWIISSIAVVLTLLYAQFINKFFRKTKVSPQII